MPDAPDPGATSGGGGTDKGGDKGGQQSPEVAAALELAAKFKEAGVDDPAGALDTIKKLREFEKGTKLPREIEKELKDLREKVSNADAANKTDLEKLQEQIAESEAKRLEAEQKAQDSRVRAVVMEEARKAGAVAPETVYRLIDRAEMEFDAVGDPSNVPALIDALKKAHPHEFNSRGGAFDGGVRRSPPAQPSMNDLIRQAAGRG
jgi:hypothetical protein